MSMTDRFLKLLDKEGLKIQPGDKPGELKLVGDRKKATPDIMRALKAFKPDLLRIFAPAAEYDLPPAKDDIIVQPQQERPADPQ